MRADITDILKICFSSFMVCCFPVKMEIIYSIDKNRNAVSMLSDLETCIQPLGYISLVLARSGPGPFLVLLIGIFLLHRNLPPNNPHHANQCVGNKVASCSCSLDSPTLNPSH